MDGAPFDGSGFTTVSATGTSFGCTSSCSADFATGSTIELQFATSNPMQPFSNYRLAGWRGCLPAGDRCTLTLDDDVTVIASVEIHPRLIVHVSWTRDSAGRGWMTADRQCDELYKYRYQYPLLEWCGFALELGESVTLTPAPGPDSHFGGWTGPCVSAGTGPCTLAADTGGYVRITARFDPNVEPQYRLTRLVPLDVATAMRGGKVVGAVDGFAATYDVISGEVTKLLANGTATAVNRRGDVAGTTSFDRHPFVVYANGAAVQLKEIDGGIGVVALSEAGMLLGTAINPPSPDRPTFTFDGQSVTWLDAPNFSGRTINDVSGIGGCVGIRYVSSGALFRNGVLSDASPHACVDLLNANGLAVGTGGSQQYQTVWDGTGQSLWPLVEAKDLDDAGRIAGAVDFDGYSVGSFGQSYVIGFHAALYSDGTAQDLNYVTDSGGIDAALHVPIEHALAIDSDQILVTFRNGPMAGVLQRVKP